MGSRNEREINLTLPPRLILRFRRKAGKKFGYKKGCLSSAAKEAIELWLKENKMI